MEVQSLLMVFMTFEVVGGTSFYPERIKVLAPHSPFSDITLAGSESGVFLYIHAEVEI